MSFLRQQIRGGTLIDIGANVGLFTLSIADLVDDAVLFEPGPEAVTRAQENLDLNQLDWKVYPVALSDRCGELLLEDRGGASSTNRTLDTRLESPFRTRRVEARTLDSILDSHPVSGRISLIKIDVEGHEECVIRGMHGVLERMRPELVMFEYLQRTNLEAVRSLFSAVDYEICRLSGDRRLVKIDGTTEPLQDLLAVPVSR